MLARNIDAGVELEQNYGRLRAVGSKVDMRVPTLKGTWRCFYENLAKVLLARYQGDKGNHSIYLSVSLSHSACI